MNKVTKKLKWLNIKFNHKLSYCFLEGMYKPKGKYKIAQNVGSVYGIFLKISEKDFQTLLQKNKGIYNEKAKRFGKYYVLYWGKDIHPSWRISEHYNNNTTSIVHIKTRTELHNFEMIWGCILTKKYDKFEQFLIKKYQPMLGGLNSGKSSSKIEILN